MTLLLAVVLTSVTFGALPADAASTPGVDVSNYQRTVDWRSARSAGTEFAYLKATEGTTYVDPYFGTNYVGAYRAGVIRGAYHFAIPSSSSGAVQANFLIGHGGAWSADNLTLPAALDLENRSGYAYCYGKSQAAMRAWIADFLATYRARTTRYAVIYTRTSWWNTCVGDYRAFAANHPLWLAAFASSPGPLPAGWGTYTFWQYTSAGRVPGVSGPVDREVFNGSRARLLALANNTR